MKNPFSGLFRARDKPGRRPSPRNALNGSAFSFMFGRSAAGKLVNERSAMQMSAVYACVRVLSEAIASMPLHFYRYNDTGGKEKSDGLSRKNKIIIGISVAFAAVISVFVFIASKKKL